MWIEKCTSSCAAGRKTKLLLIFPHRSFNLEERRLARSYEVGVLRPDPVYSGRILPTFRKKEFHPSYSLKV